MPDYTAHIGKAKTAHDILLPERIGHLSATLRGLEPNSRSGTLFDGSGPAAEWPHGWHWCFFNEAPEAGELGRDGHEKLGGFIPALPLQRRMWAAGKLEFLAPPVAGAPAEKRTVIENIQEKRGRSGPLIFVTLRHEVSQDGTMLVREIQTLVYRDEATGGKRSTQSPPALTPPVTPTLAPAAGIIPPAHEIRPDPVMLFRYSALTLNGHRIHYDADYARDVEGYAGIVFHAPLTATLLMGLAQCSSAGSLSQFSFRALNAIEGFAPFSVALMEHREYGASLAALLPDGRIAMQAEALWKAV